MKRALAAVAIALFLLPAAWAAGSQEGGEPEIVEIEFFQQKPEIVDIVDDMIAEFEAENPNIRVKQTNVPEPGVVLQTRIVSGDVPDLVSVWAHRRSFVERVNEGLYADISDAEFLDRVDPSVVNEISVDGGVHAYPIASNVVGVYYNKQVFDDLGLEIPQSYDELLSAWATIEGQTDMAPFMVADKDGWPVDHNGLLLLGLVPDDTAGLIEALRSDELSATDSDEMRTIAEKMIEIREYAPESLSMGYATANEDFATGDIATYMQGNWTLGSLLDLNPDAELGMFPFPADNAEDTRVMFGYDYNVAVTESSEHKEAALKFIEFHTRPDVAQEFAERTGLNLFLSSFTEVREETQMLVDYANGGRGYIWPTVYLTSDERSELTKAFQSLIASEDVDAFLEEIDRIL